MIMTKRGSWRAWVVVTALFTACQFRAPQQVTSTARTRAFVIQALLAEKGGPGGCSAMEQVRDTTFQWFPAVRFVVGQCVTEHGATLKPVVGLDSAGALYVLDSESALRFLLSGHSPAPVSQQQVVEYAWLALVFSGRLDLGSHLVRRSEQFPEAVIAAAAVQAAAIPVSGVTGFTRAQKSVRITAYTEDVIQSFVVSLDTTSGSIVVLEKDDW